MLKFPRPVAVKSSWLPANSVHGGKRFLQREVTGAPAYAEFGPKLSPDGATLERPAWFQQATDVFRDVKEHFAVTSVFFPRRIREWKQVSASFPWYGLKSLPPEKLEPFYVPEFKAMPSDGGLGRFPVGLDPQGRRRPFFKDGKDIARYEPAETQVTFNRKYLDGRVGTLRKRQSGERGSGKQGCW